jgi:hypothetical protein
MASGYITPGKGGSASKRLKIFEDITSPGEVAKACKATTASRGQGSAKVQNIDSTGISYEQTEEENDEKGDGGHQSFFESWTKFA